MDPELPDNGTREDTESDIFSRRDKPQKVMSITNF